MKRFFAGGAAFVLALTMLNAAAQAAVMLNASDASVLITTYAHARADVLQTICLIPGERVDIKESPAPFEIRMEVMRRRCLHPVIFDATLAFKVGTAYSINGSKGYYGARHTP